MTHRILLFALVALNLSQASALYPFKLIHNASHNIPLSPKQWASEFECDLNNIELFNQTDLEPELECKRDKNAWIYKQVDEVQGDFKFIVHQDSLDARFADSVYLANGHTGLDFHHYKFNSGDPEQDRLNRKLAAGLDVNANTCRRHLEQMLDLFDDLTRRVDETRSRNSTSARLQETHFRLARVLDSFGRYESGQLGGRYHSFGLYEQCTGTHLLLGHDERELVGTRYCWGRLNLDRHLSEPLRGAPKGNTSYVTGYFPGDFKFHLALCLPKSCHSATFGEDDDESRENLRLAQRLVDGQFKMPKSMYLSENLPLESVFCLVDNESQLATMSLGGKLFLGFITAWTLVCIVATYKRRGKHALRLDDSRISASLQARRPPFWSHFDLSDSWHEFLGEREMARHGDRVNLDPLNFVKCLCTLLVVMAHAFVLSGPLTLAHIRLTASLEMTRLESLSLFGFVLVDSFFVISGMMVTYIFLKRARRYERNQRERKLPSTIIGANMSENSKRKGQDLERAFSPLGKTFHRACTLLALTRYVRLVPLFFLVFWFNKTVYPYIGGGPMWDYGLNKDTLVGGCIRETWLVPFTALSAYLPSGRQCLPQTWTVSNDLFFSLIMPPVMVLLFKWPKSAFALSGLNLIISVYLGKLTYLKLDARARFEIEQLRDHSVAILFQIASYIYTSPLYRMPAIIVGTLAGYVLYKYSQQGTTTISPEVDTGNRQATNQREPLKIEHGWPWWFRGPLSYICLVYVMFVFLMSLLSPEFREYASPALKRSMILYMLLYYHLIWSLANAVLLLRLVTDLNNHFVLRTFASRFFSTAGKLSYAILLIHWDFLLYDLHNQTQGMEFLRWNWLSSMSLAYIATVPIAMIVFVVFENPMDKLTKAYLPRA